MSEYIVRALSPDTWDGFAGLAQRHNGVFGGCWCTYFHTMHSEKTFDADDNRNLKRRLVEEGRAHAALVYDGDEAVAWCEYGSPEELPNIYHPLAPALSDPDFDVEVVLELDVHVPSREPHRVDEVAGAEVNTASRVTDRKRSDALHGPVDLVVDHLHFSQNTAKRHLSV
jgi:hypothetical protein